MVRAVAAHSPAYASLHLDHGESLDHVRMCLGARLHLRHARLLRAPFEENVAGLRETVALARPLGVTVEGEIGHVGRVDDLSIEGAEDSTLTTVEEAVAYVEDTGVEAVAVSIGNGHGKYTVLPRLDFDAGQGHSVRG